MRERRQLRPILIGALGSALLWLVLSGGKPSSWLVGVRTVVAATWAFHRLGTQRLLGGVRIDRIPGFATAFVRDAIRSGIGAARLALDPTRQVGSKIMTHDTSLRNEWQIILLANTVSLLPGSLTVDVAGDRLTIHVLDGDLESARSDVLELQRRIARLAAGPPPALETS